MSPRASPKAGGKAAADSLRATRVTTTPAKLIVDPATGPDTGMVVLDARAADPGPSAAIVLVEAGDVIPSDGEIIEGVASVNEAAITGESAPRHP